MNLLCTMFLRLADIHLYIPHVAYTPNKHVIVTITKSYDRMNPTREVYG